MLLVDVKNICSIMNLAYTYKKIKCKIGIAAIREDNGEPAIFLHGSEKLLCYCEMGAWSMYPMTTNLVDIDHDRSGNTICFAVPPSVESSKIVAGSKRYLVISSTSLSIITHNVGLF